MSAELIELNAILEEMDEPPTTPEELERYGIRLLTIEELIERDVVVVHVA